jgi:hypothetical protein
MLLSHVLFRPFSRIDPPDTVGHSSPTLPFSIITFHCSPLTILNHSSQFVKQGPVTVVRFIQNGGERQCLVSRV